jgi:hypothetical protein
MSRTMTKPTLTFATSMDPDHLAHPCSLIRINAVGLQTLLEVEKLIANSMNPDQTVLMCRLVWIHAGRKRTILVLSLGDSFIYWFYLFISDCLKSHEYCKGHFFT